MIVCKTWHKIHFTTEQKSVLMHGELKVTALYLSKLTQLQRYTCVYLDSYVFTDTVPDSPLSPRVYTAIQRSTPKSGPTSCSCAGRFVSSVIHSPCTRTWGLVAMDTGCTRKSRAGTQWMSPTAPGCGDRKPSLRTACVTLT